MNWISVKERLPNKLQKVLFHWVTHGHLRNISMGYRCDNGWDIYLPYHSFPLREDVCPVTHWAELPKFPDYDFPTDFDANVTRLFREEGDLVPTIAQSVIKGGQDAREWAAKFCDTNREMLKRLADR